MPVELSQEGNLTIIGAAAAAAAGSGLVPDLFAAAEAVQQPTIRVEPNRQAHSIYQHLLGEYLEATERLTPLSKRLAAHQLEN
jgi:sugar (pentulose or hexulose) kinase